jgi:mannose-6-phosphate isomerase-like protein (cupin superfamily)
MEEKIYDIEFLLSNLSAGEDYFLDFVNSGKLEAGIIKLSPGQEDTQNKHDRDELYYIIEGDGYIQIGSKNYKVKEGSVIFVPAMKGHRFFQNRTNFLVLYVFGA